jgi:hypothetical protein
MLISGRTLRAWTLAPRHAVDEHVERCEICQESTPHVRVIRRRLLLVIAALAVDALALQTDSNQLVWFAVSFAMLAAWAILRARDRRRPAQCVRCLDRPQREPVSYLIDFW